MLVVSLRFKAMPPILGKIIKCHVIFFAATFGAALSDRGGGGGSTELCLDCLQTSLTSRCNLPFCPSTSNCDNKIDLAKYSEDIPQPTMVCRDERSLTLSWNWREELYYFLEYSASQSNESTFSHFTRCSHLTVSGLNPNETYSISLFGILLGEKQVYRSNKMKFRTSNVIASKTPVKNLNYTLILTGNSYMATVKWQSRSDLSCLYEIVWYEKGEPGEFTHRRINLKTEPRTEFNLTDLEFGHKYHFSIMSVDAGGHSESSKRRLKIPVPTCLDTFKNLTLCPPSAPNNITITKLHTKDLGNQTDLELTWDLPKLKPTYYSVYYFTSNGNIDDSFRLTANISGDQHHALLKKVQLGQYYQIKLIAHSRGGASEPAYIINRPLNAADNVSSTTGVITIDASMATDRSGAFIAGIWIGTIAIVVLGVTLIFRNNFKNFIFNYLFFKEKIDDTIVRYTTSETEDSKWELAESKLLIDKVIGFGAFGIVQKGYYYLESDKKTEVAVKTLKAKPSGEQIAQFYDEIEIMKSVPRHSHIVYLIGVVTKNRPSNPLMLVEYCALGDLQSFLRKIAFVLADSSPAERASSGFEYLDEADGTKFFNRLYDIDTSAIGESRYVLESKDLLSFARQIVLGMEFLSNLKMIHRDLAARNVLISDNNTLKISDFGLSRDIYMDNMYKKVTGGKLPFRWMALESLTHQMYTTESDVWSFGIVLWEIVTLGGNPYPTVNTENLVSLLKSGYRMDRPVNCSKELYQIMLNCWQASPNLRSTFKELREQFDTLLESEMQYISLEDSKKIDQNHYENVKSQPQDSYVERYTYSS